MGWLAAAAGAALVLLLSAAGPAAGDGVPAFTTVQFGAAQDGQPRVSGDGTRVAYSHVVPIAGQEATQTDDYVWSRAGGTGELVSTGDGVTPADNFGAGFPSISLDGQRVAFWSSASNLPGATEPANTRDNRSATGFATA